MSIDTIANFLTIIRNGILLGRRSISAPFSTIKFEIAKILKNEGFIDDVSIMDEGTPHAKVIVALRYYEGESIIHELTRISKPSRRVYSNARSLKPVKGKLGISILSTNKGLMTDKQAKELAVGGEVLCTVW